MYVYALHLGVIQMMLFGTVAGRAPVSKLHAFWDHAGEGRQARHMQGSARCLVLAIQVQLQGQPQHALQLLYFCLGLYLHLKKAMHVTCRQCYEDELLVAPRFPIDVYKHVATAAIVQLWAAYASASQTSDITDKGSVLNLQ